MLILAVALIPFAFDVLFKEVGYSRYGLWLTISDGILLSSFIAKGIGAFSIPAIFAYWGCRLISPKQLRSNTKP